MVQQVLLCLDTYDTDTTAINKLCKLNVNVFYHVLSYKSVAGLSQLCLVGICCVTIIMSGIEDKL